MSVSTSGLDRIIEKYLELDSDTRATIGRRSSPIDDLVYLALLLRANHVVDVIEIGTFLGRSASFLASAIAGKLHTINNNPREIAIAKKTVSNFGLGNVTFHTGDSLKVLPKLIEKVSPRLGAVYIDGFHSYQYALSEYRIVEPHLRSKPAAVVIFDDAHKLHPDGANDGGVPLAVQEVGAKAIPFLGFRVALKCFGSFKTL